MKDLTPLPLTATFLRRRGHFSDPFAHLALFSAFVM